MKDVFYCYKLLCSRTSASTEMLEGENSSHLQVDKSIPINHANIWTVLEQYRILCSSSG